MIRSVVLGATVFASIFLFVAFCRWEINPAEWGGHARTITAVLGGVFSSFAVVIDRELHPYG